MSFFHKLEDAIRDAPETFRKGLEHAEATVEGLLEPNRRHNNPAEIRADHIRARINSSHRFVSFANIRANNFVKWHIDGNDFFYAVSELLDSAREVIMILDWWLTPELYLRRPPAYHENWRLDRLLLRKAKQGVKIYIVVYKEVTQTMNMSSHHTKAYLESLHENIAVMRHPDHIGSKDDVEFWSHHEKVVIVDNHRASIGGLDLCFGRWDTHNHPLADLHPTDFARTLFPGQDYNNARVLDFQHVDNYVSNQISIQDTTRMPWHDVHMTIVGPSVLDVVQHFVERWNEIKTRKMGKHFRQRFHCTRPEDELLDDEDESVYARPPHGTMTVQVVRSVSDWSHGVLTEKSIQNACMSRYVCSISNTQDSGPVKNTIAKALVERILRAAREGKKFHVVVVIPEVPAFSGDIVEESSIKTIMAAQWRTINRGGHSICEEISKAGFDPAHYIRFYHLRGYDRINNPNPSFISAVERQSGISLFQAQVAQARLWLGESYGHQDAQKSVQIKLAQPYTEIKEEDKREAKKEVEQVPLPGSEHEARNIVTAFEEAARRIRSDENVSDSVSQHMLTDTTSLAEEQWLGTPQEEKERRVFS
ncbi:hypothetical protein Clacol_008712 [Clathrus columnatus]|uniref:phospholipase D n=1 Tax=Clathrus columnatus TaxID=1419009 RepID=A0AAV5ALT8_9AGAM|nr:hypothetical protein Clacol_008712 [Clathrus columnatus]